jgi:hypothetical protein
MRELIIGAGEIGQSLHRVLGAVPNSQVYIRDIDSALDGKFAVLHICFPYSERFVDIVHMYREQYQAELVIIHSTVKPGTTRQLGKGAVHSPVMGRHPHLDDGIRTFTKFIGAVNMADSVKVHDILKRVGITTRIFNSPEETELAKILCTTYYGWNIVFEKEVHRICQEHGVDFDHVYTAWNHAYNEGYTKLDEPQFVRPVLQHMPGPSGGHCIRPNLELLSDFLTSTVKNRNQLY